MLPDPQWATEDVSPAPDPEIDKHLQSQQQQQQ
jgi:hypothetical protein